LDDVHAIMKFDLAVITCNILQISL